MFSGAMERQQGLPVLPGQVDPDLLLARLISVAPPRPYRNPETLLFPGTTKALEHRRARENPVELEMLVCTYKPLSGSKLVFVLWGLILAVQSVTCGLFQPVLRTYQERKKLTCSNDTEVGTHSAPTERSSPSVHLPKLSGLATRKPVSHCVTVTVAKSPVLQAAHELC